MSTDQSRQPKPELYERMTAASDDLGAACSMNDVASIERLFQTGRLSAKDAMWELCLHSNSVEVTRCLLEHGEVPTAKDMEHARSLDQIKLFAEFGFDVKAEGHLLLENVFDSRETIDWLLDQGVDINRPDSSRTTNGKELYPGEYDHSLGVLNNAAASGDIETFDYLVSRGANPLRSLALHHATRCRDPEKTKAMINHLLNKHHLDINACGDSLGLHEFEFFIHGDDGAALKCAVAHRNMAAIEELLKNGADPDGADPNGKVPRQYTTSRAIGDCLHSGWLPALKPLLEGGANSTSALFTAISESNIEAARICLECGADPVRAEERDQLKVKDAEKRAAEYGAEEDDYKGMNDEMRRLLRDWK
ncbi:hypothetical protein Hte_006415 [Hypoxylon texense]